MISHAYSKKNRALLAELVRTDFKLRYQGSMLGYAWSLLRPLLLFLILYIVFVEFLKIGKGIPHFPVYLLLGIVIWNFFSEMTNQSLTSIVGRGSLIRKIRIPRWIIILSASVSAVINLLLNLVVVAVFAVVNKVEPTGTIIWLPFILVEVYIFALGISLFLSAFYVKYRDISYIWDVVLQAGFYMTPIIYPLALITDITLQKLIMLNPMAQAIQSARYSTISHETLTAWQVFDGGWYRFIPFILVGVAFMGGLLYFKSQAKYFAEEV